LVYLIIFSVVIAYYFLLLILSATLDLLCITYNLFFILSFFYIYFTQFYFFIWIIFMGLSLFFYYTNCSDYAYSFRIPLVLLTTSMCGYSYTWLRDLRLERLLVCNITSFFVPFITYVQENLFLFFLVSFRQAKAREFSYTLVYFITYLEGNYFYFLFFWGLLRVYSLFYQRISEVSTKKIMSKLTYVRSNFLVRTNLEGGPIFKFRRILILYFIKVFMYKLDRHLIKDRLKGIVLFSISFTFYFFIYRLDRYSKWGWLDFNFFFYLLILFFLFLLVLSYLYKIRFFFKILYVHPMNFFKNYFRSLLLLNLKYLSLQYFSILIFYIFIYIVLVVLVVLGLIVDFKYIFYVLVISFLVYNSIFLVVTNTEYGIYSNLEFYSILIIIFLRYFYNK